MDGIISFGRWLKLRRLSLYLTQDDLGRLVGCAAITIRKIEADERRPSPGMAEQLARHLDLSAEDRDVFLRTARAELSALRLPSPMTGRRETASAIPVPPTSLIGRAADVALVRERLLQSDVRLVTITGPGGVGKTRVALQVAAELDASFADGARFVPLAPVGEPALVTATLAQALGVKEGGARPLPARLKAHLAPRALLLVLDNFEHLAPAAPLVAELLAGAPRLKVLATSRAPLHISGEHEIALPPLDVPKAAGDADSNAGGESLHPSSFILYPSVQLFVARSQAVRADFALTDEDATAIAEICRRLDGLPLAIELAAARSKLFAPRALLARLGDSGVARSALWLLTSGPADLPARQQTLRGTVAWSYNLLDAHEQGALARLGVFAGGFTLDSASAVLHEPLPNSKHKTQNSTLEVLSALLDHSLLRSAAGPGGEPRFTMLETIRAFALERLAASGEEEDARRCHAAFFVQLAEAAEQWFHAADQLVWTARLIADENNIRAALGWALDDSDTAPSAGRCELGLRLAAALSAFWFWRGRFTEGRMWLTRAIERRTGTAERIQARLLLHASLFAYDAADYRRVTALLDESLALFRAHGDRAGCAESLMYLGLVAMCRCEYTDAESLMEEALQLFRDLSWPDGGLPLQFLGLVRYSQGDLAGAEARIREGLALVRGVGDRLLIGMGLCYLAQVLVRRGEDRRAEELLVESLATLREAGATWGVADALFELGHVARRRGDSARALELYCGGLATRWEIGSTGSYAEYLEALAALAPARRSWAAAAQLLGAAAALRESLGTPLPPVERPEHARLCAAIRAQLGQAAFAAAWERGRELALEDAIALALASGRME